MATNHQELKLLRWCIRLPYSFFIYHFQQQFRLTYLTLQHLFRQILQLKARYEREVDEKHLYLQHIHHLLTSDLDISQGQLLGSSGKLSWNELSTTVTERLAAVLTELSNLRSQVSVVCKHLPADA